MGKQRLSHRRRLIATAVVTILLIIGALPGPTAWATSTTLCTGYSGCVSAGLGDGGYAAASGTSFWGMYPGHNCTNYAAYRLVRNGVDAGYLTGHGNAYEWGSQAQAHGVAVDSTPAVGSIAWWPANTGGAGSTGHVAYVEQVGAGYILVSEDNYGGDFYWKRMSPGGYYPPSFIHFKDVAPPSTGTPPSASKVRLAASSVVLNANNQLEVFGRGPNGDLVHKWFVPGTGWQPSPYGDFEHLGTGLAGDPVAIQSAGQLDIFARGTNGDLLHKWFVPGTGWQPSPYGDFEHLGTGLAGDPVAGIEANGQLDVFARSASGDLLHKWFVLGTGWGPSPYGDFEHLGTGLAGDPTVFPNTGGQLDVFARGVGSDLVHKWFVPGAGWQPSPYGDFEHLGTGLGGEPNVVLETNGQLDVFARGTANDLVHKWYVPGTGWGPSPYGDFEHLGSGVGTDPIPSEQPGGQLDVFARGAAGDLVHKWFVPGTGWQPSPYGDFEHLGANF
jgi:hypothetical protein